MSEVGAVRLGLVAPQGTDLELSGLSGTQAWRTITDTVGRAQELGFVDLWFADRSDTLPRREPQPVLDSWTALGALAERVPRLHLWNLVPAAPLRNVALLAKHAATLDVISGGRCGLALSSAPVMPEHTAIGLGVLGEPALRLAAAAETLGALRALWTQPAVTIRGRFVDLVDAHCEPPPLQETLPVALRVDAVMFCAALPSAGESINELTAGIQAVQWSGEPRDVARAVAAWTRGRERLGLDPSGTRHSVRAECRLFDTVADRDRWFATPNEVVFWSHHPDLLALRNLYGTAHQVIEQAQRYLDAGITELVVWFRDYPSITSIEQFAADVTSALAAPATVAGKAPLASAPTIPDKTEDNSVSRAGFPRGMPDMSAETRGNALPFASAEWMAAVATLPKPPEAPSTVTFRMQLIDTGQWLDVSVDLTDGELAILPAGESPAGLVFRLTAAQAETLLLGSALERAQLIEGSELTISGNFSLIFFIDAALQADRAGRVRAVRAYTHGDAAPAQVAHRETKAIPRRTTAPVWTVPDSVRAALPATSMELEREVGTSSPGAQLYVSHKGSPVANVGLGLARPDVAMTAESWPLWYCCAKPMLVIALARLWEQGRFDPYQPIAHYLPDFAVNGKGELTSLQLLTHTSPIPTGADPLHGAVAAEHDMRRRLALDLTLDGQTKTPAQINYSQWWAWFVLAELLQAVDGRSYVDCVNAEVLLPYGMDKTRVCLTAHEAEKVGNHLPLIHVSNPKGPAVPTYWWSTTAATTRCIPGVNSRGPVRDQGRMLEMLLADGRGAGRVLRPPTVAAMTARHRVGLQDRYGNADWGLGLKLECRHLGEQYTSFGSFTSPRSFGHDGLWTAVAFADPDAEIVVALHFNGKVEHSRHRARVLRVVDAVYRDLGAI